MKGSGLEDILKTAYRGLAGILSSKSWPRAIRALRMVCVALLAEYLMEYRTGNAFEALASYLEEAQKTPTGRLWVDCLIKPTYIAHLFIRAERGGDWLLHLHCLHKMLPYFLQQAISTMRVILVGTWKKCVFFLQMPKQI